MFGLPDSSISNAVKAQLDAQISFFAHLSNQMLEGMHEMNRLHAQASKTMLEQSLAGARGYLGASAETHPGEEPAQDVAPETQAGIEKIVDTVVPSSVPETVVTEAAQKAPENIAKAAEQQKDVVEKVAARMSQTRERGAQGKTGAKPDS